LKVFGSQGFSPQDGAQRFFFASLPKAGFSVAKVQPWVTAIGL